MRTQKRDRVFTRPFAVNPHPPLPSWNSAILQPAPSAERQNSLAAWRLVRADPLTAAVVATLPAAHPL